MVKHKGSVQKGKLILDNTSRFIEDVRQYEGKHVQVSVSKYSNKRSIEQNNYYWGVVLKLISDHTGHTSDEMHEFFLGKFFGTKEIKSKQFTLTVPIKRSTKLSTIQMEEYLESIRVFALTELNITIPLPNEVE